MNTIEPASYREWLKSRARRPPRMPAIEPEILRYSAWRNYQALRDWDRRAHGTFPKFASIDRLARRPTV